MNIARMGPGEPYDDSLSAIDEEICQALCRRQALTGQGGNVPPQKRLEEWARQYGIDATALARVFGVIAHVGKEPRRPPTPERFLRFVPVGRSLEQDGITFAIPVLKQYENLTIVYLEISAEGVGPHATIELPHVELSLSAPYQAQLDSGNGHGPLLSYRFLVTPPLPDDVSSVTFRGHLTPREGMEPAKIRLNAVTVDI